MPSHRDVRSRWVDGEAAAFDVRLYTSKERARVNGQRTCLNVCQPFRPTKLTLRATASLSTATTLCRGHVHRRLLSDGHAHAELHDWPRVCLLMEEERAARHAHGLSRARYRSSEAPRPDPISTTPHPQSILPKTATPGWTGRGPRNGREHAPRIAKPSVSCVAQRERAFSANSDGEGTYSASKPQ